MQKGYIEIVCEKCGLNHILHEDQMKPKMLRDDTRCTCGSNKLRKLNQ